MFHLGCLLRLKFQQLLRSLGVLTTVFAALLVASPQALAQGSPFNCDVVFYQVKNTSTFSQIIKFASVSNTVTPTAVYSANQPTLINSLGYNAADNYMYGLVSATAVPSLTRIGTAGYQLIGNIVNSLPGGIALGAGFFPTAGVFDAAGRYYFAGQAGTDLSPSAIFRVDSIPATGVIQVSHQYNLVPGTVINFGDFDFNGAGSPSGLLLGAAGTNAYRVSLDPNPVNPALGTATVVVSPMSAGPNGNNVGAIGSAFYDAFVSKFYVFDNTNSDFWEISNPLSASPTPLFTNAVPFVGLAPFNVQGASPTDGTSCPISGVRKADLRVTKTDGVTSLASGAVTSYIVTVVNNGPYPANYSVLQDPPAAGLKKLSVTCTPLGGPPSAVCPATLSVATLEAGVQIISFPPTTTLQFTVNTQVTQTAGNFVTNTVTITPAPDTTLITPTFTFAFDVNAVTAPNTTVTSALSFCPAGTSEAFVNLIANGDFSAALPFTSGVAVGVLNTYAVADSVSRQTGSQTYAGPGILQNPFPGDAGRSVANANSWLLSNGKTAALPNYSVWLQPVTGLVVGRTYQFMTYQSNAVLPGQSRPTLPDLRLQVSTGAATTTITPSTPLATESVSPGDTWRLVQGTFTASVSAVTLSIANFAGASVEPAGGDVAGIAQATLRACNPAADVAVTKTNGTNSLVSLSTTAYTITVVNLTPGVNATNTLIVDPGVTNLQKNSITCVATAGSSCPGALSILAFEGSGLTIPLIVGQGTVTFNVAANVTGPPGSTASNFVTVSGIGYTDSNPANNQGQDSDPIIGTASLSISKSNGVGTLTAGTTTTYTVTVSLTAGSQVIGAVLKDPAAPGLSCTAVSCVGTTGATSCPAAASVTIADLQGAGIVLPSMSTPSSVIFTVTCGVRATGL